MSAQTQTIMNMKTAAACMAELIRDDVPVFLWGPPGIGKSEVIDQVAADMKYKVIDIRASIREPVDMRGIPVPDLKTRATQWFVPSELPNVKRDGPNGILKLDELPNATTAMQAACLSLVLERMYGEYRLPKGWVPVAAGNRLQDKAGAQRMITSMNNRFAHIEVGAEIKSFSDHAVASGKFHPLVIAFTRWRPEELHRMPTSESERSFPTPRAWERVSKFVDSALRAQLVEALVGRAAAIQFEAFCQMYADLPKLEDVLSDPGNCKLPAADKPSQMYAMASGLARHATKTNLEAIIIYTKRLPKEFDVLCITDAVRRDPGLSKTRAFINWATANQNVMGIS